MAELADASSELSSREVVFGDINRLGLEKHIVERKIDLMQKYSG